MHVKMESPGILLKFKNQSKKVTEKPALIMVIKTDIMNLNWLLYGLVPLSLCRKMNCHKLWLDFFYLLWRKDNISFYCSSCLQRIMDKWVQSDQDPLKYLHYMLGVIFFNVKSWQIITIWRESLWALFHEKERHKCGSFFICQTREFIKAASPLISISIQPQPYTCWYTHVFLQKAFLQSCPTSSLHIFQWICLILWPKSNITSGL